MEEVCVSVTKIVVAVATGEITVAIGWVCRFIFTCPVNRAKLEAP